jgi:regulator of sigma E protease
MITYWILFIILFGAVVFIHELGHFTVAKLSGVFVERFALGFGPALLKKKWGETEYAICAFPLGGYVKMRGEEIEEGVEATNDPRSFALKSPRIRIAIAMMGPTSNLILPVVLFTGLFVAGMPTLTSRIGYVAPASPADQAGLKPGDKVTSINGTQVTKWTDLEETIRKFPNRVANLTIDRQGKTETLSVTPKAEVDSDIFGKEVSVGKIGVSPNSYKAAVGITNPNGAAAHARLKTGDVVTHVNGKSVHYFWEFAEAFTASNAPRTLKIERRSGPVEKETVETKEVVLPTPLKSLADAGIENGELYVREVKPDSVAAEKGIHSGDRLVAVNGVALDSWTSFQTKIRQNSGEKITLTLQREGKAIHVELVPKDISDINSVTRQKETRKQLGVVSVAVPGDLDQMTERYLNPFTALAHGFATTVEMTALTIKGLGKLVTGELALKKSLGGPISIFYLAGGSYETGGWTAFIRMMALLSITLGVINLLPIPVLDGGHILFFVIEAIKGSPVSLKVRELAHQAGFVFIIGLMLLTFYVDIERYFLDKIKALFN